MDKLVDVINVSKYYGKSNNITKALDGIDLSIYSGEFVSIMGPSGSGKTTLLNCIATIDSLTGGKIVIDNQELKELSKSALVDFRGQTLGFIFQDFSLLETLSAYDNIALALSVLRVNPKEIKARVIQMAKHLEIEHILDKYPSQLSGGEKQRVSAARALITNPKLLLADEPTGALDSKSSRLLLERLGFLNKELQTTILMVTHDAFSASYSDRILFIKDGKIFNELIKGDLSRKAFFDKIIDVMSLLGGDVDNVF